jgi:hypothetical protein
MAIVDRTVRITTGSVSMRNSKAGNTGICPTHLDWMIEKLDSLGTRPLHDTHAFKYNFTVDCWELWAGTRLVAQLVDGTWVDV